VADLLECLIQIKGLADTPRRLARRTAETVSGAASPDEGARRVRDVACRLLLAEREFRRCLSAMLSDDGPALPGFDTIGAAGVPPGALVDCEGAFAAERAGTVRLLEACSAEQLNRRGIEPLRGPMTVADLVAVMLAHDTDRLGELVNR
jgi:hypothetical protein